jgi:MraZ protein
MAFRGTYDHTLDAKNRLTVPARFRADLAGGVVLFKNVERCLSVWKPDVYNAFVDGALEGLNPLSPEVTDLKRHFAANAFDTELDGAGRIMIPPKFVAHAGLAKDVVVNGMIDRLEIWDRDAWATEDERLGGRVAQIIAGLGRTPAA